MRLAVRVESESARSRIMRSIRGAETEPERLVRSFLHREGLRFRKNVRSLPGRPDIVLRKHRAIVFVHGCFWHRHQGCSRAAQPRTNAAFWKAKFAANVTRDRRVAATLRQLGWRVFTIWECEVRPGRLRALAMRIAGRH
jgi:DNA mismatch endonuclease, patch repair protein